MLQISNLTIFYKHNDIPSLKDFSLDISKNSLIVISGNSGSGKSTLAKSLINLLPKGTKRTGKLSIDNVDLSNYSPNDVFSSMGFLPQFPMDYNLNLLVYDEVAFPLENLGFSKQEISKKIDKILTKLQIKHLKNKIITELSSGELQKVSLATAIVSEPKILILDEPFARMDPNSEINLIEIIKELKKDSVIIILEHHLDYILEIADWVVILDNGLTVAQGIPKEIIDILGQNKPEISQIIIPTGESRHISFTNTMNDLEKYLSLKGEEISSEKS